MHELRSVGGWKMLKLGRLEAVEEKRRRKVEEGKSASESLNSETGESGYSQVPTPGGGAAPEDEEAAPEVSIGSTGHSPR